jgi:hypothetical protein
MIRCFYHKAEISFCFFYVSLREAHGLGVPEKNMGDESSHALGGKEGAAEK